MGCYHTVIQGLLIQNSNFQGQYIGFGLCDSLPEAIDTFIRSYTVCSFVISQDDVVYHTHDSMRPDILPPTFVSNSIIDARQARVTVSFHSISCKPTSRGRSITSAHEDRICGVAEMPQVRGMSYVRFRPVACRIGCVMQSRKMKPS